MTDARRRRVASHSRTSVAVEHDHDDEVERNLGRGVALGLPVLSVVGAVVVGLVASAGSGLLILASGALLGAIAFFWASVRTLSGDAPLAVAFESLATRRLGVDALSEQKRRLLMTLKDLESEHDLGKIDDGDYSAMVKRTRDETKAVMREMDVEVAPLREEAERLAAAYLRKRGLAPPEPGARDDEPPKPAVASVPPRLECGRCRASNEVDATFCKQCGLPVKGPGRAQT